MDDYKAYQYYVALRLHFTVDSYNVFTSKGHIRGSREAYNRRRDKPLFQKLARQFPKDREYIQYIASNFLYGHLSVIYEANEALANYKEFIRRKQSITKIFEDDLDTIKKVCGSCCNDFLSVVQLMMSRKITIETVVILNQIENFIPMLKSSQAGLLIEDELRLIDKAQKFVKFDLTKIMASYQNAKEDN